MASFPKVTFAIDRGGTFTDVVAVTDTGHQITAKVLSVSPSYPDAPSEGIRQVLEQYLRRPVQRPIPTEHIAEIRMGTTVATNALLERKGAQVALAVTAGFRDALAIGTQARAELFALNIQKPDPLPSRIIEVDERMRLDGGGSAEAGAFHAEAVLPINTETLRTGLQQAFDDGYRCLAVALVHSFANPAHEEVVRSIAVEIGFTHISCSSALVPMIKFLPRCSTAVVNAYLSPVVEAYLKRFRSQFEGELDSVPLRFMKSDGGLVPVEHFDAFRSVLSGPAGGVTGCARVGEAALGTSTPLVGFDMGGTSTDVCRCSEGGVDVVSESVVAGVPIQVPQVDVHTVAAGGGSILQWRDGLFVVGPESAGAQPGPKCYGRGGPLTITDANVMVGRVQPALLPSLFGVDGRSPIDVAVVNAAFKELAAEVSTSTGIPFTPHRVAQNFLDVANEQMCRPIRALTEGRGFRCSDHTLVSFGGAGGQHAVDVARRLGIGQVYVHRHASVLSAVGIGCSSVSRDLIVPWGGGLVSDDGLRAAYARVEAQVRQSWGSEVLQPSSAATIMLSLSLRFDGTQSTLFVPSSLNTAISLNDLLATFRQQHDREFGFVLQRTVVLDSIRVTATSGAREEFANAPMYAAEGNPGPASTTDQPNPAEAEVFFSGTAALTQIVDTTTEICGREEERTICGPALLRCRGSTVVLDPDCIARVSKEGNISITLKTSGMDRPVFVSPQDTEAKVDPGLLSVFSHRFMSIAEQMGHALRQTAVSTNIKERLDFSCAIFDADANLVANAPHIPVHLGAMGATVAYQKVRFAGNWQKDDVIVCNHPAHGGSHLPDITVITPVVLPAGAADDAGVFAFVASRAHHSDIGGITPGSMPPFSSTLDEEGAVIEGHKLVNTGTFDEEGITALLMAPAAVPGCSGCRQLPDVLSDLRAQVAANRKGVELLQQLVGGFTTPVVRTYMTSLQLTAERAVRALLRQKAIDTEAATGRAILRCRDYMDDGTPIALTVELDRSSGDAVFDFTECGEQVLGSANCPKQVVRSAVLYSLRCLLNDAASAALPLNEGCMRPVTVRLRPGTILSPSDDAAIVAGNVLTSQRITDVVLAAFGACACAQGDMNNLTFGNDRYSYYETVCGGSGAGPAFAGADAVHTHMTNTRITDVEWLESRFPVLLRDFSVRVGSGGSGRYHGGNGVVRSFVFLESMTLCMLSERRALAPAGLEGGKDGLRGRNIVRRAKATAQLAGAIRMLEDALHPPISIGGKAMLKVGVLDVFTMLTPGGGGFGTAAPEINC